MRRFYTLFPNQDALRRELSWTHYRLLLKVELDVARLWYMTEAATEGWSTRALERQINSFYAAKVNGTSSGESFSGSESIDLPT
jgi:predicted nuclease of restriction endonuclease-like (RecB) superfamily